MSGKLPANSQGSRKGNILWTNRINISTNGPDCGRIEFDLTNGSEIAIALTLRDPNYISDTLVLDGQTKGIGLFSLALDRKSFTNGMFELKLGKLGNQCVFTFSKVQQITAAGVSTGASITKTFTIDGLGETPLDGWTMWMPGFADKEGWSVNWSDSLMQWVNVDYWQDLPNRFRAGDVVVADVEHKTVYVNGVEAPDLYRVGNEWDSFYIQPGDNSIMPIASSWAQAFDAQIEWREAYV
jgi:hypothetical protein